MCFCGFCNSGVGAAVQGVQSAAEQGLSAAMMKIQVCEALMENCVLPSLTEECCRFSFFFCESVSVFTGAVWSAANLFA